MPFQTLLLYEPGENESDFALTPEVLLPDLAECIWDAVESAETIQTKDERSIDKTAR